MVESISDLFALAVGVVVFLFLWQSLSGGEFGRDRDRQLRHEPPLGGSGVNRPARG